MKEYLYRYQDWQASGGVDEWGYSLGPSKTYVSLMTFRIIRTTPKGVWINYGCTEKFVKLDARKRFACPTKEEALESFLARKQRQKRILSSQLQNVVSAIHIANGFKNNLESPEEHKELDFSF